MVNPHHVAHGVQAYFVEAAFAHPGLQLGGAGAVGVRQVGDGELTVLAIAWVAVLCQRFGPVPDAVAALGHDGELVLEPDLDDAMDVAQALGQFEVGVTVQTALKRLNDLLLVQPAATRAAHCEDEGPAELGFVVGVEPLDLGELFGCALRETGLALLVGGLGREAVAHHGLARKLGVGTDEFDLAFATGARQHLGHRMLQMLQRAKGSLCQRLPCDPGGVLVQAVEHLGGRFGAGRIEFSQGDGHVGSF